MPLYFRVYRSFRNFCYPVFLTLFFLARALYDMKKISANAENFTNLLLPPPEHDYEAILAVERGPKWRHSIDHESRKHKANGHVFIILRAKNRKPLVITFRARYLTGDDVPDARRPPEGEAALESTHSFLRSVIHFQALKTVSGEIDKKDDFGTCFDTCRIYPITQEQYRESVKKIAKDRRTSPSQTQYQLAGLRADNCVSFSLKLLESMGIKIPDLWKAVPWPCMVSLSLELHRLKQVLFGRAKDFTDVTPSAIRENAARQATTPAPA